MRAQSSFSMVTAQAKLVLDHRFCSKRNNGNVCVFFCYSGLCVDVACRNFRHVVAICLANGDKTGAALEARALRRHDRCS